MRFSRATEEDLLPYRLSLRTSRPASLVLDEVAGRELPGVHAGERGPHYVLLQARMRQSYGPDLALGLGLSILLAVLIGYAFHPLFIGLLPLSVAPGVPLLLQRRQPLIALGAVPEPDGGTRLTAHGEVSAQLAEALDGLIATLPAGDEGQVGSSAPPPPPEGPPAAHQAALTHG